MVFFKNNFSIEFEKCAQTLMLRFYINNNNFVIIDF